MDKQNLINIAKDQLKGGIAEAQVRELLTYRGLEENEVNDIMQSVLAIDGAQSTQLTGKDIINKTHNALLEVSQEPEINPEAARKERIIILGSVIGGIFLAIVGSIVYFLYF